MSCIAILVKNIFLIKRHKMEKYEVKFFENNCIDEMLKYKEIYSLYVVGNSGLPSSTWNEKFSNFYEYVKCSFSKKKCKF